MLEVQPAAMSSRMGFLAYARERRRGALAGFLLGDFLGGTSVAPCQKWMVVLMGKISIGC